MRPMRECPEEKRRQAGALQRLRHPMNSEGSLPTQLALKLELQTQKKTDRPLGVRRITCIQALAALSQRTRDAAVECNVGQMPVVRLGLVRTSHCVFTGSSGG